MILLVAPAGLFRDGVAHILGDLADRVEVACADYTTRVFEGAQTADVLVLDGDCMSEALNTVRASRRLSPGLPVLVLLTAVAPNIVEKFLSAGVARHLEKSQSADSLLQALRILISGERYSPSVALDFGKDWGATSSEAQRKSNAVTDTDIHLLTPRQIQVLALAARGESNKSIARELKITEGTVKVHLYAVYRALKVDSRGQASVAAARLQKVRDTQLSRALDGQLSMGRLLAYSIPSHHQSGEVLFHKDDPSDALYYLVRGTVGILEIGINVGPGTILGEIGLFSPDHRRTCTACCKSDCDLLVVSATDAMRLHYQDPEFATYLIHLITRRLESDKSRLRRS
ncbi:LuxR C-terminal-related transcriptional regulator [Paraburkholderia sp. CNPSo 3274]|uniref:LuxR C-terminal-related transcriptional regulator n=1 Tax=Paraburkholderia sp. CNPSo 3274 TaxID=2940932 RepID=UPI0020B8AEA8|nr:LuxR C-terminal-related transcriptional regulator [Paraburkholderia sp. CNPSo 3274]MCP3713410.1 LuxR C-terminal-related transcriptional regulator [Paraburkholderia sp. CNPSo 3274]